MGQTGADSRQNTACRRLRLSAQVAVFVFMSLAYQVEIVRKLSSSTLRKHAGTAWAFGPTTRTAVKCSERMLAEINSSQLLQMIL